MNINKLLIVSILLVIITTGAISAADTTQNDNITASDSSDALSIETSGVDDLYVSVQGNDTQDDSGDAISADDAGKRSLGSLDNGVLTASPTDPLTDDNNAISYDGKYYLFRGDCWVIDNNFESSAAVTSDCFTNLTVTGTFRTQNDLAGLYWYSQDTITHPYISYGSRTNYTNVILEFDYNMTGLRDFNNSATTITIKTNAGEIYYLTMNRFINNSHVKLDFNNLTILPGNSYQNSANELVKVNVETKLDVTDLKYIMFPLVPINYNGNIYTIMENMNFTCKISNITVTNGEICDEQEALEPHQYRLCEGYDDSYNLNPFRLAREMRKLGYTDWVDLYIGASHYYEKNGTVGDVITEPYFNHNRTEKMVLDENVPLNAAFMAWLDCYSCELKKNNVTNLVISVSMENLQCPQSWRQMNSSGNFATTDWEAGTFLYSPCNDDAVHYMQNVSEACLDIVVANGLKPILQMGETWWSWKERSLYFYDNSTKEKYKATHNGANIPKYSSVYDNYNPDVMKWLNKQLVDYSDALQKVVKNTTKYENGIYMALIFLPSITSLSMPQMIEDINYPKEAYSPDKVDILQIEDYDWVIWKSMYHESAYAVGQELGFTEDRIQYFGGFVQYSANKDEFWPLIEDAMDEAIEKNFDETYVWAGSQVRRDYKIIGYDEYVILGNLKRNRPLTNLIPKITAPAFASVGENFTIKISTDDWVNGTYKVYEYKDGKKGKLLASNAITEGTSSVNVSSTTLGLNKFYLEFNYTNGNDSGRFHLIYKFNIIENSKNIAADVTGEIETGSDATINFKALESPNTYVNISIDGKDSTSYPLQQGEFTKSIPDLTQGYHTVLVMYNDTSRAGEAYYKVFKVKVGVKTSIEADNITPIYNSSGYLTVTLKDSAGNTLQGKEILITLNGTTHKRTTNETGQATLIIEELPGNYTAQISYKEEDIYLSSFATANVYVKKIPTNLTADTISYISDENGNLIVNLKDYQGRALEGKKINITFQGITDTQTTDANGNVTFILPQNLLPDTYKAEISFDEDNLYNSTAINASFIVTKVPTNLTADKITFVYDEGSYLVVTLKSRNGTVIKGREVSITLDDGTFESNITDENGQVSFYVDPLPGNHTANVSFEADDNWYLPTNTTAYIEVFKVPTYLTAENITFVSDNGGKLTVYLKSRNGTALKGKELSLSVSGKSNKTTTDSEGKATFDVDLLPGNYTAEITFAEDTVYLSNSTKAKVDVYKIPTVLTSKDITFVSDDGGNLIVTLKDRKGHALKDKIVFIKLNGTTFNQTTDANGQASFDVELLPGNYTADIFFKEDDVYLSNSTKANVDVYKIPTNLTAKDITFVSDDGGKLIINLKDRKGHGLSGKDITIILNKSKYTRTTDSNGQAILDVDLLPGKYTAEISFMEDKVYLASSVNASVDVDKIPTNLTAKDLTFIYDDKGNLVVTLKDRKGHALSGKDILIFLDNSNYTRTTNKNGQVSIQVDPLPGNYTAEAYFDEDEVYLASSVNASVDVYKVATSVSANNITFIYSDSANLAITLKDRKGNAVRGKGIIVTLNGTNHYLTTNNFGQTSLPIDLLPGSYVAEINSPEDSVYLASTTEANVVVNKLGTSLTANNVSYIYDKPKDLMIILKDSKNRAIKEKELLIKLNGQNHTLTTNDFGQVSLPIGLLPGTYTAEVSFTEDNIYLSTSAKANIVISKISTTLFTYDISFIYGSPSDLVITLMDSNTNYLGGKEVSITINGVTDKVTTNEKGIGRYKVELLPGDYSAAILFAGDSIYSSSSAKANIAISKISTALTANNVNTIYGNPATLTIALKDSKNIALAGKALLVTVKDSKGNVINSSSYTTNDNGVVTLPVDYDAGSYKASISFAGDEVYIASSAASSIEVSQLNTQITASDITVYYTKQTDLTATLKDEKGNALSGMEIIIRLDNGEYRKTTDSSGQVKLPLNLKVGKYTANIQFTGTQNYINTSKNVQLNILDKITTKLSASDLTIVYGDTKNLVITLKNDKGVFKGQNITVNLNNVVYNEVTDSNGQVIIKVNLPINNYNAEITYAGDDIYKSASHTAKVSVIKATPKLTVKNAAYSVKTKTKKYTILLKNHKNVAMKKVKVYLKVNGKVYSAVTGSNGKALFKITKLTKKGKYTALIVYKATKYYNGVSKKAKIVVK